MKKTKQILIGLMILITFSAFSQDTKLVSTKSHIKFYSHTAVEDIEANNHASVSTIKPSNGEVVVSVPMQGFEFEKAMMQKHFNNDKFLNTKEFPKAKLKGKITNLEEVDFTTNGSYQANVEGEFTIKGITKDVSEKATIVVNGELIEVISKFNITLADYGVSFVKGKPSTNIAKEVEVTMKAEYQAE